jgi:poly(3-hydroxybutyrate) depolymerase
MPPYRPAARRVASFFTIAATAVLLTLGSGVGAAVAAGPAPASGSHTLQTGITIPGFPHQVDVYRPAGAVRAIVYLHGLGGRNFMSAYDLGFNRFRMAPRPRTVDWEWLAQNQVMAVFPQGMSRTPTAQPTWTNYVTDSGQDDVAFLSALSTFVRQQYGATTVTLAGHSSGGVMAARMWCEATASFEAYVSVAGPMPSSTYPLPAATCTPRVPAPYLVLIGNQDSSLPAFYREVIAPSPEHIEAGLTDGILVGEWWRHRDRAEAVCGEVPELSDGYTGGAPAWAQCDGRVRYVVIDGADHSVASLEAQAGYRMRDAIDSLAP